MRGSSAVWASPVLLPVNAVLLILGVFLAIGVVGNVSEDPVVMVPVVRFVAVTAEQKRLGSFVPRPGVAYSVQLAGTPTRVGVSWWLNLV